MSRAAGFAAIPTWMFRDGRVPRSAILVYGSLASRSGLGAIFPSQKTIATECGLSVRTVRTMLGKLEELGVLERHSRRGDSGRQTSKTDGYLLYPNGPVEGAANFAGRLKGPANEGQGTGNQRHGIPLIEVDNTEVHITRASELAFERFYAAFPRKAGRALAERAFLKAVLSGTPAEVIVEGAVRFANDPNLPEKQFIPHPSTWLNAGRWDDEPLPERIDRSGRPSGPVSDDFAAGDEWMAFR